MKSDMKTWCSITTRLLTWQRSLKTSILTMYHVSKMHMQMHCVSRRFIGPSCRSHGESTCHSHDLYCYKFALEDNRTLRRDLQVKEVFETSTSLEFRDWRFPYTEFVLYGILPDDSKEAAAIRRKAPRFYYSVIIQTLYRQSYDGILL